MKKRDSKYIAGIEVPKSDRTPVAHAATVHAGRTGIEMSDRVRNDLRQAREEIKDNVWDDVLNISASCHALLSSPAMLLPAVRSTELMAEVEDIAYLNRVAGVLANDVVQYTGMFAELQKAHSGRKGGSTDEDDLMLALQISNGYQSFSEQFNANVMPMINTLSEIITKAELRLREKNADAHKALTDKTSEHIQQHMTVNVVVAEPGMTEAQDPSVITDATITAETVH